MPQEISDLTEETDMSPAEDFSNAFDDDSFELEDEKEEKSEEKGDEKEEKSEEKKDEKEEEKEEEEETALEKAEKRAKEKFSDSEEDREEKKDESEQVDDKKEEEAVVDYSDVDENPSDYVTKLVDGLDDEGRKGRLVGILDTYPELGELIAVVAKDLSSRQKVKVVKDENSFDFSKEELEALKEDLGRLNKSDEERALAESQRKFWDEVETLHPGARKMAAEEEFDLWLDKQSVWIQKLAESPDPEDARDVFKGYDEYLVRTKASRAVKDLKDKKDKRDSALSSASGKTTKPTLSDDGTGSFEDYFETI